MAAPRHPGFTGRVGAAAPRHRRLVMVGWLVLFVAGGIAAGRVTSRLTFDFALPGHERLRSKRTSTAIAEASNLWAG